MKLFSQNVMDKICEQKITELQGIISLLPNENEEFYCSICKPISEAELATGLAFYFFATN